jgi:membrane protein involved in colicin uptake
MANEDKAAETEKANRAAADKAAKEATAADKAKKAEAREASDKAAREAAEPQLPEPGQEEADAIKEGVEMNPITRDFEGKSSTKTGYKTR